ncbi:MAG: DUF1543 domain-containing protein [Flavisolibacter sp.]
MPSLFMTLVGATPKTRNTEQHDVFFGIADSVAELVPDLISFWPEAADKIHLDAWRTVTNVNGYKVEVVAAGKNSGVIKLFFINLGGYKPNEFEEFHYKMIIAAANKGEAIQQAKQTAFYKHTGFKGAPSHIDDKFGVDVDDIFEINDILPKSMKEKYALSITGSKEQLPEDEIHLGYFKLDSL